MQPNSANELALRTTWARDYIEAGKDEDQLAYLQVDIEQLSGALVSHVPLNLVMVLDRSGSMGEANKMDKLKEAVCQTIDLLGPNDYLSVILFDEVAETLIPRQVVANKSQLKNVIMSCYEQGGTKMAKGIELARQELLKNANSQTVSRILLLTDGQTWGDQERCVELAAEIGQAGTPIYAFGLGDEWNLKLLQQLTEKSSGQYDYLDNPNKLAEAFTRMVAGMQKIVASKVKMLIRLSASVKIRAAYRLAPLIVNLSQFQQGERELYLNIGDIERDQANILVLELLIPTRQPGVYRAGQLQLDWEATSRGSLQTRQVRADMILTATTERSQLDLPIRAEIMSNLEKAQAFKLQTIALNALAQGDKGLATIRLKQQATILLNLGETELAAQVNERASQLAAGGTITAAQTIRLAANTQRLSI